MLNPQEAKSLNVASADNIRSMTGFGSAALSQDGLQIRVELRSVNHRFLKVAYSYSGADCLGGSASLQHRLEEKLRSRFSRGALSVNLKLQSQSGESAGLIDRERLQSLHKELLLVAKELKLGSELTLRDLLPLDGVIIKPGVDSIDSEAALLLLMQAFDQACSALDSMQLTEGAHLHQELSSLLEGIEIGLNQVTTSLPGVAEKNRDHYREKLQSFLTGTGVELEDRDLLREVALLAEKADVTEEVSRLRGHFQQFKDTLAKGGVVGRKLDFLTQEMLREASTMAAKVNRYEMAQLVVEVKAGVDKLREQLQNIA